MSQELYIPPEGIFFRLLGYASHKVLFSRSIEPQVGHDSAESGFEEQYFSFIYGTGDRKGTYAIKSKVTGNVLFSRTHHNPNVGHIDGDGRYDDNWFTIEPGKGQYAKQFRLITRSASVAFVSRTHKEPYLFNHRMDEVYPDQYFTFLYEDINIDKIDYDLELGKIISSMPVMLANQTLVNGCDKEQEMSFQLNETVTHTSSFEYSSGFTITLGFTFEAGVPIVSDEGFSVEACTRTNMKRFNSKWGEQTSTSKTYKMNFLLKAGPHSTMRVVSTVNKGCIEVPFTVFLRSVSSGIKLQTKGVWRGVSAWDIRHTVSSEKH